MKLLIENWRKYLKEELEVRPALPGEKEATMAGADPGGTKPPKQAVRYSGVVLDDDSVNKLRQAAEEFGVPEGFVFETKAGEPLPHHMTIVPFSPIIHPKGKHDFSADYPVGEEVTLIATAIGADERAMAARVDPPAAISPKVKFPHITLAIPQGGKPFFSNKIPEENFQALPQSITLKGTVEEVA